MSEWFERRRFMVTGGSGFLGRRIVAGLEARGAAAIFVPRSDDYDLRELEACQQSLVVARPDVVIHAAGRVGGIAAAAAYPATFFYDNAAMSLAVLESCLEAEVEKVVAIGTVCSYPASAPVPFREADLWEGYPEETNAPYGIAKRMLLVQQQAYRRQYGMRSAGLLLANLYGPGDDFHPETSHVIPALVRKCVRAADTGEPQVEVWGSGRATREFLYVDDAAEAVLLATEHYESDEPVNIGTGSEISIAELATLIAQLSGFGGELAFDPSRPDGQARRSLDVSRATEAFGFQAPTALEDGLRATIEWWRGAALEAAA